MHLQCSQYDCYRLVQRWRSVSPIPLDCQTIVHGESCCSLSSTYSKFHAKSFSIYSIFEPIAFNSIEKANKLPDICLFQMKSTKFFIEWTIRCGETLTVSIPIQLPPTFYSFLLSNHSQPFLVIFFLLFTIKSTNRFFCNQ